MMTLDDIRARLRPMNLAHVSRDTGIHYNVLIRLVRPGSRPEYETVRALS